MPTLIRFLARLQDIGASKVSVNPTLVNVLIGSWIGTLDMFLFDGDMRYIYCLVMVVTGMRDEVGWRDM